MVPAFCQALTCNGDCYELIVAGLSRCAGSIEKNRDLRLRPDQKNRG